MLLHSTVTWSAPSVLIMLLCSPVLTQGDWQAPLAPRTTPRQGARTGMSRPTAEAGMPRREAPGSRRHRAKLEPRGNTGESSAKLAPALLDFASRARAWR
jgi:hypothetical protein